MPQTPKIILDATRIGPVNPAKDGRRQTFPARSSQLSPTQQSMVRAAVSGPMAAVVPSAQAVRDSFRLVDAQRCDVTVMAAPGFPPVTYAHDVTIGVGFDVTCAAGITISGGGGLYFSTLPEVGVYASIGGGLTTNASVFFGGAVTVVFGPPSTFAGDCLALGVDFSLPPPSVLGGGGALLFELSPPYDCIGFVLQFGLSPSWVPFDVTVQLQRTTTSKF
ncbi:MAG TPA: hypothetical protein VMQ73_22190 [Methylomirabilota bacterium]|nr:hypothetical protein [Methylomirabilota bacterium]